MDFTAPIVSTDSSYETILPNTSTKYESFDPDNKEDIHTIV